MFLWVIFTIYKIFFVKNSYYKKFLQRFKFLILKGKFSIFFNLLFRRFKIFTKEIFY